MRHACDEDELPSDSRKTGPPFGRDVQKVTHDLGDESGMSADRESGSSAARKVRVIVNPRDGSKDYQLDAETARKLFHTGELDWDLTNGTYCKARKRPKRASR